MRVAAPFHIVLHNPVIPQNTGSIARLCACTGASLHLIHPLGFSTDASRVKRAGLDYWDHVEVVEHAHWPAFLDKQRPEHLFFFSKKAKKSFTQTEYPLGSYLVFGSETQGLPAELLDAHPDAAIQIPMRTHLVRSLNLSTAAGIVLYEALRQRGYPGIAP